MILKHFVRMRVFCCCSDGKSSDREMEELVGREKKELGVTHEQLAAQRLKLPDPFWKGNFAKLRTLPLER